MVTSRNKVTLASLGISADPFGLLDQQEKRTASRDERTHLHDSFEEISEFVEAHSREPRENVDSVIEFQLYSRLKCIRESPRKVKLLQPYDFLNLLSDSPTTNPKITDLVVTDQFGLLNSNVDDSIFSLKNVKASARISPEYLSRRKVCREFRNYSALFESIHEELADKDRFLARFRSEALIPNSFHVLNGLLLYVENIDGYAENVSFQSGPRTRFDGRTRVIFENGTESDMLFRSLEKAMLVDGYDITERRAHDASSASIATDDDVLLGYIYVLRSKSNNSWNRPNLYKIGHTSSSVLERIKNAKSEPTYLFSDVSVISAYRCLNISSNQVEKVLHEFFSAVRLDIELTDSAGNLYYPREWFFVDMNILDEAIGLFLENRLGQYFFDKKSNQIVAK